MNEIYIRYKHILSGCRTIYDALYFAQYIIKEYPESKKLINGMIHGKTYEKILDFRKVVQTINILNELKLQKDVNEYINNKDLNASYSGRLKSSYIQDDLKFESSSQLRKYDKILRNSSGIRIYPQGGGLENYQKLKEKYE